MPKTKENAKILLLDIALEIEKTEMSAEIRIKDPSQMKAFLDQENDMMQNMVTKVKASGADIVFCQKGIDDMVQHFLAKAGIMAARRVKESDMEKLARATGGRIISDLDDLKPADLGLAGLVDERKIGDDKMIFVEKCKDPHSVAILIRAGLERMVDEAERAITDSLSVVSDVIENNKIVPGGGAVEIEVAKELRKYATKVGGREQLAVEAFADAVEVIPRTLAENAGLQPIDILVELRSKHDAARRQKHRHQRLHRQTAKQRRRRSHRTTRSQRTSHQIRSRISSHDTTHRRRHNSQITKRRSRWPRRRNAWRS